MNDHERLRQLIDVVESFDPKYDHLLHVLSRRDLRIFVQKIKEQQQEIERLTEERNKYFEDRNMWIEASKIQEEQLRQAQEQIKQLENRLKNAYFDIDYEPKNRIALRQTVVKGNISESGNK
jgi:hypothetical protein